MKEISPVEKYNCCPNNHRLIFTYDILDSKEKYSCSKCNANELSKRGRYYCEKCKYSLCWNCLLPHHNIIRKTTICPQNHNILFLNFVNSVNSSTQSSSSQKFNCSICKAEKAAEENRWVCKECNYFICTSCKDISNEIQQTKIDYILKCPKAHSLIFSKEKCILSEEDFYICVICSIKGKNSDSRWSCLICGFDLCWNCRSPSESVGLTCKNFHPLIFTPTKQGPYSNNLYTCSCCNTPDLFCDMGRFCCIQCKFDLCWNCRNPEIEAYRLVDTCLKKHQLTFNKNADSASINGYFCWACRKVFPNSFDGRWSCIQCRFDLCSKCKGPKDFGNEEILEKLSLRKTPSGSNDLCKICYKAPLNCAFIPCGHMCSCFECASEIPKKICPFCKSSIQSILKTFKI